jgi:hypothetical protein
MRLVTQATSGRSHSSMTAVIESLICLAGPLSGDCRMLSRPVLRGAG